VKNIIIHPISTVVVTEWLISRRLHCGLTDSDVERIMQHARGPLFVSPRTWTDYYRRDIVKLHRLSLRLQRKIPLFFIAEVCISVLCWLNTESSSMVVKRRRIRLFSVVSHGGRGVNRPGWHYPGGGTRMKVNCWLWLHFIKSTGKGREDGGSGDDDSKEVISLW